MNKSSNSGRRYATVDCRDACAGRGWSLDWCDIVTIVEGDHRTTGPWGAIRQIFTPHSEHFLPLEPGYLIVG